MSTAPGRSRPGEPGPGQRASSGGGTSLERGAHAVRRFSDAYGLVFSLILVTFLVIAVAGDTDWGGVLLLVVLAVTLLITLHASQVPRSRLRVYGGLILVATAAAVVAALVGVGEADRLLINLVSAAFVVLAPVTIVRRLRGHEAITMRTVMGALCIYLFIGMFYAVVYGAVARAEDSPFFAQVDAPSSVDFIYFSFVTLATVGYGDLSATTDLGRMLAVTEGLLGQVYLVTIVAVLVSNLGRSRPGSHDQDGRPGFGPAVDARAQAGEGAASADDAPANVRLADERPDGAPPPPRDHT